MCAESKIVNMATDLELQSLFSGAVDTFFTPPSTWGDFLNAKGLRFLATLLEMDVGTDVRFFGQWSNDRRKWTDFTARIDAKAAGAGFVATSDLNNFVIDNLFVAAVREMGPYVRLGIEVRGDSKLGRARITAVAQTLPMIPERAWNVASAFALASSKTLEPIGSSFNGLHASALQLLARVGSIAGSNLDLFAQASPDAGSTWFNIVKLNGTTPIGANGNFHYSVTELYELMRIVYTTDSGTSGTLTLDATLRAIGG